MNEYKTTWREKIFYGVGAIGLDMSYGMFYTFLSHYLVTTLGLSEGFLLLLTPLARIWDGINDPLMGTIVDNTRTKFGKYRPWILIGAASNGLVLFLLFSKFGLSGMPLYVYIAVMYILWGMTNTLADIPYWSMIPSFTSDPKDRNMVSTVARAFSGFGQGLITIATPIIVPLLSGNIEKDKDGYSPQGFSRWAAICGVFLVIFALICVLSTKEKNVIYGEKKKFSLKKIFTVIKSNDQLVIFMVCAILSNAGWYLTSATATTYFTQVVGNGKEQSIFQAIGAAGSVLGLLVVPLLSKWFTKKRIYQISILISVVGYVLMYTTGPILKMTLLLDISYIFASTGIASMFVSQTIFLADIVDYGEYKNGERNESVTFSMKGLLQKIAYTIQTVIYYGGLGLVHYSKQVNEAKAAGLDYVPLTAQTKTVIGIIGFAIPPILMLLSLIIFSKKYKLHGELADEVHEYIVKTHAKAEDRLENN